MKIAVEPPKEELTKELLEILVCPEDKGGLWYLQAEAILYNPRLKLKYKIQDGIPIMLVEESEQADQNEHKRLLKLAEDAGIDTKSS